MGILLTTEQAALKIGIHKSVVGRLVRTGKLQPVNKPEDGKRVAYRFDPKVVREFKATYTPKADKRRKAIAVASDGPGAIRQQLSEIQKTIDGFDARIRAIETAVQHLIAMWS